ncbi:MAG TPA: hypothetical protein DCP28_36075, partial [Cytophagales bacterium]|nr:hypothetical protein [Cytophagales bacterium]
MGMIRVWDRARTADQIAVDYQDIYTLPATGLLGQWTFDNETVNLTSDVSAAVLSILTDNVASHPISWTPSYAFVEAEVQKEVTTWLQEPVADGTPRTYEISIYETGTGRLLTQSKDDHTFSHPGTPVVTATASKENPYQIGVSVFPYSQRADEYAITRADGKGNLTNLGTVGYTTQNTVGEFDNTDYIKFENTRLVPSTGWYLHVPFKHYESTSPQGIVVGDNINYEFRAYVDANNQLELSYHRAVDANAYTWVNTQAEVTPNEWHDLIVVQNASSGALDVYLDQALVTSFEASSTWLDLRYIGSGGYGANHAAYNSANFHGQIAYVNYHATPLTEDQVLNMTREYPQGNLLYWTAEGMQWVLNGIAQTPTLTLESDIDVVEGIDFGVPFLGLEDAYAYGDATSILGDDNYTYTATPVYNQLDRSYADDAHAGISNTVYTMDYGVSATALNDETGITVDWNVSSLTGAGYDTVRIERNGDVLALTPTTNSSWTDTLMLYGIDYTYSVIAMGNGQPALAQSATTRLSANGSVTATLISQNGDYVLPNKTAYLTTEGATVATVAADTYGAVDATGIFYDQSMDFSWADASGNALTDGDFTLTRHAWEAQVGFVRYDTALNVVEEDSLIEAVSLNPSYVENAVGFDLTLSANEANATVFVNVYRDGELIGIVYDTTLFVDRAALPGTYDYTFQAYYYTADGSELRSHSATMNGVVFPDLEAISNFQVVTSSTETEDAEWTYSQSALVTSFTLIRTNTTTGESFVVATVPHQTDNDRYTIMDSLGYPGNTYDYRLTATTLAGETVDLGTVSKQYNALSIADIGVSASASTSTGDAVLTVEVPRTNHGSHAFNGILLMTESGAVIAKSKAAGVTSTSGNEQYTFTDPNLLNTAGTFQVALYKHTDEGLFVTDTETATFSGATAIVPTTYAIPSAPALATNSSDLQVPTLTASKDAEGMVFVAWEYPHYTDVEFTLSYKAVTDAAWNTVTLPNEQRAWLHEAPAARVMEYKILATYQ